MQLIARKGINIFRDYYIDMEIMPPFTPKVARVPIAKKESIEKLLINPGDTVKKYQIIAVLKNGVQIHSPFFGNFKELFAPDEIGKNCNICYAEMDVTYDDTPVFPMWDLNISKTKDNLIEIMKQAGIIDECTGEFLVDYFGYPKRFSALVIDGVDEQPYDLSKTSVLLQYYKEVIDGARILAEAMGISKVEILVNKNFRTAPLFKNHNTDISVKGVKGKYPLSIAVKRYIRRKKALRIGAISARALFRAFYFGEPQLTSICTVWGEGVSRPANMEVYNGTPINEILLACGAFGVLERVVAGGIMQGYTASPSWPLFRSDGALTVLPVKKHHKTLDCISCGRCSKVCPLGLAPYYLLHESDRIGEGKVKKLCAELCMHCGACSYICPSRIPLGDYISEYSKRLKRGGSQ